MIVAHSSEIEIKKTLILKGKRLDLLGRKPMADIKTRDTSQMGCA